MALSGRSVLLTGASRGLGVDMAKEFARRGSKLVLAARSAEDLEQTKKEVENLGGEAVTIAADVCEPSSQERIVDAAREAFGPIDVLVNNAGIELVCDFETMPPQLIDSIINTNVLGLIRMTRLVVPEMVERRRGHIVNISSMAGLIPVPHNTVYSASKHAVAGFSHSLRLELADHNVGVSVVCPGFVDGGMFAQWGRPPPSTAGSVTPQAVAKATADAVLRNLAEVKVNKPFGKLGPLVQAISPRLNAGALRASGVVGFLRKQAEINARQGRG